MLDWKRLWKQSPSPIAGISMTFSLGMSFFCPEATVATTKKEAKATKELSFRWRLWG
jgi:hypothetical protein